MIITDILYGILYDDCIFCHRWSSMVSEEHKYGYPDLHQLMASAYWKGEKTN